MSLTGDERVPLLSGPGAHMKIEDIPGLADSDHRRVPLVRGGLSVMAKDIFDLPAHARVPLLDGGGLTVSAADLISFITPSSMAGSASGTGAASGAGETA